MTKPIRITVKGTDNRGDDAPTVQDLLSQVQDQVDILNEVDRAISGDGAGEIVWRVTDVTKNSPITFEITPYPKTHGMDIQSRASEVVATTANGFRMLAERSERPVHFTDKVLKKVVALNKRVTNGLSGSKADFSAYIKSPNYEVNHNSAVKVVKRVDEILTPPHRPHRELGSVEGYIKTVGRDGFGRPVITLTTRIDGSDIKCVSRDGGLDKIIHLEVGKVIRGMRIRAHGILLYKSPELLERIEVERVETFDVEADLPEFQDLIDQGFSGDLDSVEYIRMGRDYA